MAEKKITKRERFVQVMDIVENCNSPIKSELVNFINHEVELLNRKKVSSSTPSPDSKKGKEMTFNKELESAIYNILSLADAPMRVSEILAEGLKNGTIPSSYNERPVSISKITSRINHMQDENIITRIITKGNSTYSIVA